MYKLGFIFIFFGALQSTLAQHILKKEIGDNNKNIEIICRDIDQLNLQSIDKNQVWVEMQDAEGQFTDVDIIKQKNKIIIKQKEVLPQTQIINKFCVAQPNFASYLIKIPKNSHVYLKIESGNLNIENFIGFVNAEVGTGIVLLNNNLGDINLKIIDGSVKAIVKNAQLKLSTNLGSIQSSISKLQTSINKKLISGVYENALNRLEITAIKANIYLEAVKQ